MDLSKMDEVEDLLGDNVAGAEIDGPYRYRLWRIWDRKRPAVLFICLNPSTADAFKDDPTVRRLRGFARSWGYGGFVLVNLFAFRATSPDALVRVVDPSGPKNDATIKQAALSAVEVVVAWGSSRMAPHRAVDISGLVSRPLVCLGTNKDGQPKHPLYLPCSATRTPWICPR
jgi:hypothetical protein